MTLDIAPVRPHNIPMALTACSLCNEKYESDEIAICSECGAVVGVHCCVIDVDEEAGDEPDNPTVICIDCGGEDWDEDEEKEDEFDDEEDDDDDDILEDDNEDDD